MNFGDGRIIELESSEGHIQEMLAPIMSADGAVAFSEVKVTKDEEKREWYILNLNTGTFVAKSAGTPTVLADGSAAYVRIPEWSGAQLLNLLTGEILVLNPSDGLIIEVDGIVQSANGQTAFAQVRLAWIPTLRH